MIRREGDVLHWSDRSTPLESVTSLVERFEPWTGRAWLQVCGPDWQVPIDQHYGANRRNLRLWCSSLPFRSDWSDGDFPSAPGGLPPALATLAVICGFTSSAAALAVTEHSWSAGVLLAVGALVLARVRDRARVSRSGLRIGPAWAPMLLWSEIEAVEWQRHGRTVHVWARSPYGSAAATLPLVLLPALVARIARVGRVPVREAIPSSGARYERWLAPATGAPWGVLLGAALITPMAPTPWLPLFLGLTIAGGLAMLGAAIHARATGWGMGAVFWLMLLYSCLLFLTGAAWRGWML